MQDSTHTSEGCLVAYMQFLGTSDACLAQPYWSASLSELCNVKQKWKEKEMMRFPCVPCPSNHYRTTSVLLMCEGITKFPVKLKTQAFLCPAEHMGSVVLKLISNGKLEL